MSGVKNSAVVASFSPGDDGKIVGSLRRREAILERYGVGCVRVGEEGRKDYGGPMVPGPWAYVFRMCNVIASGGHGSGKDSKDALSDGSEHFFSHGDIIEIDGVKYVTSRAMNDNTHLEPVPAMDLNEAIEALKNGLTMRRIGRNEYEAVGSIDAEGEDITRRMAEKREERLVLKAGPMVEIETDQFKRDSGVM